MAVLLVPAEFMSIYDGCFLACHSLVPVYSRRDLKSRITESGR